MSSDDLGQAQAKDPIVSQIVEVIHNKSNGKWKMKSDMDLTSDFELESGNNKLKQKRCLYRRALQINNMCKY